MKYTWDAEDILPGRAAWPRNLVKELAANTNPGTKFSGHVIITDQNGFAFGLIDLQNGRMAKETGLTAGDIARHLNEGDFVPGETLQAEIAAIQKAAIKPH